MGVSLLNCGLMILLNPRFMSTRHHFATSYHTVAIGSD
jgi:hypothetical protein